MNELFVLPTSVTEVTVAWISSFSGA